MGGLTYICPVCEEFSIRRFGVTKYVTNCFPERRTTCWKQKVTFMDPYGYINSACKYGSRWICVHLLEKRIRNNTSLCEQTYNGGTWKFKNAILGNID